MPEDTFEKLAVVVDEKKVKTAQEEQRCPECHGPLVFPEDRNIAWCPKCGTHPFEPDIP